jgi:hypothetical protein
MSNAGLSGPSPCESFHPPAITVLMAGRMTSVPSASHRLHTPHHPLLDSESATSRSRCSRVEGNSGDSDPIRAESLTLPSYAARGFVGQPRPENSCRAAPRSRLRDRVGNLTPTFVPLLFGCAVHAADLLDFLDAARGADQHAQGWDCEGLAKKLARWVIHPTHLLLLHRLEATFSENQIWVQ